jgi:hypothetical protein
MRNLFWLLLFTLAPAQAATMDARLAKADICGRYEVIHINGVVTTPNGANANLTRLIQVYGNSHNNHLIAYALAYNPTRGLPTDLYQSMLQVIADFPGATFADWVASALAGMGVGTVTVEKMRTISQRFADANGFTRPPQYQDQDLADIILAIRQNHRPHGKLLLVPHSQGNLYANLVYDQLTGPFVSEFPAKSVMMAHLANAATTMRTGNHYVTTDKDLVIKAVRWAVPAGSQPNAPVSITTAFTNDLLGHKFIEVYMGIPTVKTKVVNLIKARLDVLKTTAPDPLNWVRSSGAMYYCGQLAPYYGPAPWACWMPDVTKPYPQPWSWYHTNMITVPIAGSAFPLFQPGTLANAESATRMHSTACYNFFINDRIAKLKATVYTPPDNIPGCGTGYPSGPYSVSEITWSQIYSADSQAVRATYDLQPPVFGGSLGQDVVNIETLGVCRR